ncbi:sigma-70 family RNA polymerase sigma factor [Candidatus Saganbacteria bacterium]|nr:sigma-70 family RNA polymerase sigma factor [Candidatus Saganbacteria bacterium]
MTIRRISDKEIRKAVSTGPLAEAAPTGLPPILRASWKFAQNMAKRFNRELMVERLGDFLKQLSKKFVPPKSKTVSRKELEDRIIEALRAEFMKYSDETLKKYDERIKATVRWYVSSLPRHIASSEAHDLEAEAKIAFMECLKTWDPRKGELWPYVSFRLKGAMQDYLRKRGGDPVAGLYEHVTAAANVYMAFNNKHIADEGTIDKSLHLESALKDFPEKERAVIIGYYQKDKTFKEIGKEIGLSESQVSRICKDATEKLKTALLEPAEPLDITADIMKRRQF